MIQGVTLNYSTGHVTERGGSASPKRALSEKLLFRKKNSYCSSFNCFWISKRYHFPVVRQPATWDGFHQGVTTSSNAEQSALHCSKRQTGTDSEMKDEGVC